MMKYTTRITALRFRFVVRALIAVLPAIAVLAAGCEQSTRPEIGNVHGRITLDGKPVKNAGVGFRPETGARESTGVTDADGNYSLHYIRDIEGAAIGWHTVRVTTGDVHRGIPELIPEKYNALSKLRKEVVAGENVIDFELSSK